MSNNSAVSTTGATTGIDDQSKQYQVLAYNSNTNECSEIWTSHDPKHYAMELPRGLYTVMRTVDQAKRVLQWDMHVDRLLLDQSQFQRSQIAKILEDILKVHLMPYHCRKIECKIAVFTFMQSSTKAKQSAEQVQQLHVHLSELHTVSAPDGVQVEVGGPVRSHATQKDTQWIKDRDKLMVRREQSSHEILLYDGDYVYEGSTSNFFAILGNRIITSPLDVVLPGTMQDLLFKAVSSHDQKTNGGGNQVKLSQQLSDPEMELLHSLQWTYELLNWRQSSGDWDACFLTSTSRAVVAINRMRLPTDEWITFDAHNRVVLLLQKVLTLYMNQNSHQIIHS